MNGACSSCLCSYPNWRQVPSGGRRGRKDRERERAEKERAERERLERERAERERLEKLRAQEERSDRGEGEEEDHEGILCKMRAQSPPRGCCEDEGVNAPT